MVSGITTVRMQLELKNELDTLKVIDREPYESVIKRLVDYFKEDLELSEETKKLISQRMKKIEKGQVISTKELLDRLKKNKKVKECDKNGI